MNIQHISRAAIMASAQQAFLSGKTVNDCSPNFKLYEHTWRYEFRQAQFQTA